jgi:hypothetical protein
MRAAAAACASWRGSSVAPDRERILSEFIDAWNAGRRPELEDYLAQAEEDEREELISDIASFLAFAPTPAYSEDALQAIRAEAEGLTVQRTGVLPALLASLRARLGLSTGEVAGELIVALGLPRDGELKTARYVEQLENGDLDPTRVSRRVFDALGSLFRVSRDDLEGAADLTGWIPRPAAAPAAAPVFRADEEVVAEAAPHIDLLADALATPGRRGHDEVDELFLGGR